MSKPLGSIWPWPPWQQFFFHQRKSRKTWFGPFCVSTSGQQKFGPPLWNPKYTTGPNIENCPKISFLPDITHVRMCILLTMICSVVANLTNSSIIPGQVIYLIDRKSNTLKFVHFSFQPQRGAYYQYYNLRYNPSAPFVCSGFLVSYRIRSAMKTTAPRTAPHLKYIQGIGIPNKASFEILAKKHGIELITTEWRSFVISKMSTTQLNR